MDPDAAVLSIHREYADAIFAGAKNFELRRLRPRFGRNTRVFVYVPVPLQVVVGWFYAAEVLEAAPPQLWRRVRNECGLSRSAFDTYFTGAQAGFALRIGFRARLAAPIPLSTIRRKVSDFSPPQSYQYLLANRARDLRIRECIESPLLALAN